MVWINRKYIDFYWISTHSCHQNTVEEQKNSKTGHRLRKIKDRKVVKQKDSVMRKRMKRTV